MEDTICPQCGKVHKTWHGHASCSAHLVGVEPPEPCSKPPKGATGLCRSHGANLPSVARAAEQKIALMQAQGEIATLMREVDIPDQHPLDGLLEVVRVSGSMMRLLTVKVGELNEDPETREVMEENPKTGELKLKKLDEGDGLWGYDKDNQRTPHIWVQLLRIWSERYERACKTALDAGIDERKVRLAEDTADTFFTALSKATATAGLSPAQLEALMRSLARELRTDASIIELI